MLSTGKQITAIHILSNISKSKGNLTVKFKNFLKNHKRNAFEKPAP